MRIAQFTESYRPVINGVAVAVDLLTEELLRLHGVDVYAPSFPGHIDEFLVQRFPSYVWPLQRDYPLAIPFSPSLYASFLRAHYDVVHTHSPFALGQAGLRWARKNRIPVVTTYHTLYVEYAHYAPVVPERLARSFLRSLSRRYCNACDRVAVPTEPIRNVLLEYGVRKPIDVIPTGLRLRPPRPRDPEFPRRHFGIPQDALVILYAGRLAREKNLELLFHAFERAADVLPRAWLLLAGSGPLEEDARRMAKRTPAPERVVFAGFLPPERMPEIYSGADVFAFASLTDTQGLVLTEAKAAGLPAVSVDAYGPSAVVKDGVDGLLVPNDPDLFGAALIRILKDETLRTRMREAAVREAQSFSIQATASAYERLYREAQGTCAGKA
jgi:1,2-diacylglycerol 3-alpha-glucosyltransferase